MPEKASVPFLGALPDTAEMIERLREELAVVEAQRGELEVRANDLATKVSAFNTLRQAHGLPPL